MIGKLVVTAAALVLAAGGGFWLLTEPERLDPGSLAAVEAGGDVEAGRIVFFAAGCSSCHAAEKAKGDDRFLLGGGREMKTEFGTFVVPNISQHPTDGIGSWSFADLANAMKRGVSPDGRHYYPAFPYASYARMELGDIADLYAFLKTLPAVEGRAGPSRLAFPYSFRRGVALWKKLNLSEEPAIAFGEDAPDPVRRGAYLVEGPGHCGECHTPRGPDGAMDTSRWLAGAPALEGQGRVPNITSGEGGLGSWSESDIAYYLETGFTPDYDSVGGAMAEVQANLAELPAGDRAAIAAYLKAIPPQASAGR